MAGSPEDAAESVWASDELGVSAAVVVSGVSSGWNSSSLLSSSVTAFVRSDE